MCALLVLIDGDATTTSAHKTRNDESDLGCACA
jgi:hypothetical protein